MQRNLTSILDFGKYRDLTIAEALSEPKGFGWMLWAIENVSDFNCEPKLEEYIRTTIKLQSRDRKYNPQNYLHEKSLKDLKAIAEAMRVTPTDGRKKDDYVKAIKAPQLVPR